jgi:hypothetical protein
LAGLFSEGETFSRDIPARRDLFVDGPDEFLQIHQRQGGFHLKILFQSNWTKKKENERKKPIISNNLITIGLIWVKLPYLQFYVSTAMPNLGFDTLIKNYPNLFSLISFLTACIFNYLPV